MWLEGWFSGFAGGGFAGAGCPFVDVVGPGCRPAVVVPEASLDVVGEQGGVEHDAFFGVGMARSPVMLVVKKQPP